MMAAQIRRRQLQIASLAEVALNQDTPSSRPASAANLTGPSQGSLYIIIIAPKIGQATLRQWDHQLEVARHPITALNKRGLPSDQPRRRNLFLRQRGHGLGRDVLR